MSGGSRDDHLKKGDQYVADQKFSAAIVEYKTAVQLDGRHGPSHQKLGEAYLAAKEPMKAYRELVTAADLMPDNVPAQLRAGDALIQVGQFDDAKARAEGVIAKDPQNVDALILKGTALAGLKQMGDALDQLNLALRTDPTRADTYAHMGALQYVKGDLAQAEAAFKKAINFDPKSIPARLALANLYWSTNRQAQAEQAIKEANQIDPTSLLPNQALAMLYLGSGRLADAEAPLKNVVKYSDDYRGKIMLADYYANVQRLPEAKAMYETVAGGTDVAGAAVAKLRLASLGLLDGDKASAYRQIEEILKTTPRHVEAMIAKAQLKLADGQSDEALASARAAVDAEPGSPQAQYVLGMILKSRYQIEDSERAFNDALRGSPGYAPANVELARLYMYRGKFDDAARYAQAAIDAVPGFSEAYLLLARSYMAAGNPTAAERPIRALQVAFPDSPAVQAEVGRLLMAKGDAAGASSAFAKALAKDALQPTALEGAIMLEMQQKGSAAAKKRLDAALAAAPKNADLQLLGARLYAGALKDREAAEAAAKRALDADAGKLEAYDMLARLNISSNNLQAATVQFQKLADKQPKSVANQTAVGLLLQLQNKPEDAKIRYEKALALDSKAPVAANNLAQIYVDRGENLDVALNLAQTAKAGLPKSHEVDDTIGWIYYKKGNAAMAISSMKQAVGAQPENFVYLYHLGASYALGKDKANARLNLEKALKLKSDFQGADDARKILDTLK